MKTCILLTILLAFMAIMSSVKEIKSSVGIDFYLIWTVSKAQKWSEYNLQSPYVNSGQYNDLIDSYAISSYDSKFQHLNSVYNKISHHKLDLTGTPLFYWIFRILPQNFSLSFYLFQALKLILFILSVVILNSGRQENRLGLVALGLLLSIAYEPFLVDIRVGNINSFQLFLVVVLILFADRVISNYPRHIFFFSVVFMCALVFLTLLKPNLILVILLLGAYLWALLGTKVFARSGIVSVAFGGILLLLPCIYFNSWEVWLDWYNYISIGSERLVYPIDQGNYSTVLLISKDVGMSIYSVMVVLATILTTLGLVSVIMAISPNESRLKSLGDTVVRLLRDPFLCAAIGITVTLALMPLVWYHYYVMSLIPAIWLLTAQGYARKIAALGGLSILLTSGLLGLLLIELFGWLEFLPYSVAMGWIPLGAGIFATIVGKREQAGEK